jgi:hypothetical protein
MSRASCDTRLACIDRLQSSPALELPRWAQLTMPGTSGFRAWSSPGHLGTRRADSNTLGQGAQVRRPSRSKLVSYKSTGRGPRCWHKHFFNNQGPTAPLLTPWRCCIIGAGFSPLPIESILNSLEQGAKKKIISISRIVKPAVKLLIFRQNASTQ